MAPSEESSHRLRNEPISPLQLATNVMYDEEEVPNTKCMHIVEEEVSLSQPKTIAVPPEEEEVPVPHGPSIVVPPEEEVPSEEEEVPAPHVMVPPEEEKVPTPLSRSRRKEGDALS
jgi:hypothetical protein